MKTPSESTSGNALDDGDPLGPVQRTDGGGGAAPLGLEVQVLGEAAVGDEVVNEEALAPPPGAAEAPEADEVLVLQGGEQLQALEELRLVGAATGLADALHGDDGAVPEDPLEGRREAALAQQVDVGEVLGRRLHLLQVEPEALGDLLREATAAPAVGQGVPAIGVLEADQRRDALLGRLLGADPAVQHLQGAADLLLPPAVPGEGQETGGRPSGDGGDDPDDDGDRRRLRGQRAVGAIAARLDVGRLGNSLLRDDAAGAGAVGLRPAGVGEVAGAASSERLEADPAQVRIVLILESSAQLLQLCAEVCL